MSNKLFKVAHEPRLNTAYVYLTGEELSLGRKTVVLNHEELDFACGKDVAILLDFKDGKLVGIEFLNAAATLHQDLLAKAE